LRCERKFYASGVALAEVELLLRTHPAHFRVLHPTRHVNNVYLDTPNLARFLTHVDGCAERIKLRVRWYGAALGTVPAPVLERKARRGGVGSKLRVELPPLRYGPGFDTQAVRLAALARCGGALAAELAVSEPVLFNRYRRSYYLSADGRFRVTLDSELRFEAVLGRAAGMLRTFTERDLVVVELKYDPRDEPRAERVAGRLPFRLSKFSKYVAGVTRLAGLKL
jgi:hypothetical protein